MKKATKLNISVEKPLILILVGLIVVILTLYTESEINYKHDLIDLGYSFFKLLGFTIFTSGIFTILLQLPDWQNYFENRLKKIVLEQDYLNSLDNSSLSALQTKTLKAFFRTSDIDKEGSFLNYFQENLNKYISEPFRDDVKTEICVVNENEDSYEIVDRITYRCRMVGGKIQSNVIWKPDKDEFKKIFEVKVNIKKDKGILETKSNLTSDAEDKLFLDNDEIEESEIYKNGLLIDLKDYQEDMLFIEIISRYTISKESFCNWSMAHPTKNFYISINYPKNIVIRFQPLLLHPDKLIIHEAEGKYSLEYKEWLLPMSGVVYSFINKDE
jgi:hypothetical protein